MLTADRAARLLGDRTAMRRLLNESGRSCVRAAEVASLGEVPDRVRELGLPLVARYADRAGGHAADLLGSPAEVASWTARREAERTHGPYLLEELVEGPVFGVCTLTVDGAHHVLALTARQTEGPLGGAEVTELYPAPLDGPGRAEVRSAAAALLDLAGYEFGLAYVQVALAANGAHILAAETGPGNRTPALLRLAAGIDPELWLHRALAGEPVPHPVPRRAAAAADFRLPDRTGRVFVEASSPTEVAERIAALRGLLPRK